MEPETLIPLSVITPGEEEKGLSNTARPVVVLCGDIKQLPAIVSSDYARQAGLDVSLLERLMERPLYQESEQHITCLAMNYRSHSGILWLPNTLFYNNRLQPCNSVPLSKWPSLPNPRLPILVKHVEAEDDWVEEVSITKLHDSLSSAKSVGC
jgi:superfamily I DNA and/or RNA helicase